MVLFHLVVSAFGGEVIFEHTGQCSAPFLIPSAHKCGNLLTFSEKV